MKKDKYGRYIYEEGITQNRSKEWTIEDIRFCMRDDMKLNDIALALGRTTGAVSATRYKVRKGYIKI